MKQKGFFRKLLLGKVSEVSNSKYNPLEKRIWNIKAIWTMIIKTTMVLKKLFD